MENVILEMTDAKGKSVTRTIDATNAFTSGPVCWEKRSEPSQRISLERWISERGNDQHATKLTLNTWEFEKK